MLIGSITSYTSASPKSPARRDCGLGHLQVFRIDDRRFFEAAQDIVDT